MPSIYDRLKLMRYTSLTQEQKVLLGKSIADNYFRIYEEKNRPPLCKKKSHEPHGTFDVWVYPKRFTKKMDTLIKDFCKENHIRVAKRNRLSAEKVTSSTKR